MESERIVKNNEIEIEEVNVYTDDCGTTRKRWQWRYSLFELCGLF